MPAKKTTKRRAPDDPGWKDTLVEPYADDLAYLNDELHWINLHGRRIALDVAMGRQDERVGRRHRSQWDDDELSPQQMERLRERLGPKAFEARQLIDRRLERHRQEGRPLALDRLCESYGLDHFQRTILLLAAAPCLSRRFETLYGKLDWEEISGGLTVEVAFAFLETPFEERVARRAEFGPRGVLVSRDLITVQLGSRYTSPKDLLCADIEITSRTFNYLLGDHDISEEFLEFSSVEDPLATFDQVVLGGDDKQRILSVVERHERYLECRDAWGFDDVIRYGRGVLMLFHGRPGTGKTMSAHAIAHAMGKRILNVDIPTFVDHRESDRFLPALFREARLQDSVLFFDECEVLFGSRMHGNALMTLLLTELERFEGVAILATNIPQVLDEALDRRILVKVRFPEPDRQARLDIWRKHLPDRAPLADDVDLEVLADRYELTGGYIKNAVLAAVADAVHSDGESPVITMRHLERAAGDQLRRPRDEDEDDLVMTQVRLDDVVLPADVRDGVAELIDAARNRRTVLERWGIGAHLTYGKGVSALLHGEPGTGKTLCAEAVAGELGRPLLTASVPALLSRWVGGTEANLERMFARARAQGAVLFLDEADSLLGPRDDGRAQRHDVSAVNVLLKLVERHQGVVLLATNLPDRLDRALTRRLTYALRFPFPDAGARSAIWRRLLPVDAPLAHDVDPDALGRRFALSGGHIKNAVFKAAFRAASADEPLGQSRLLDAAAEEELAAGGPGRKSSAGFAATG